MALVTKAHAQGRWWVPVGATQLQLNRKTRVAECSGACGAPGFVACVEQGLAFHVFWVGLRQEEHACVSHSPFSTEHHEKVLSLGLLQMGVNLHQELVSTDAMKGVGLHRSGHRGTTREGCRESLEKGLGLQCTGARNGFAK